MREMTVKEVQQVSLDILKDVHDFCEENHIRYSLSGGTLLGAIRHDGFIPWDDDLDIQLPRPDYEKLIHTYTSRKGYRLFCKEIGSGKGVSYTYARICEMKKTYVDTGVIPWIREETGVWIDILPCDGMPSNENEARKHLIKLGKQVRKHYLWGIKVSPFSNFKKGPNLNSKLKYMAKKIVAAFVRKDPFPILQKERLLYEYSESDYFIGTPKNGMSEWQPKKNMEKFILHKFEDSMFYIMSGYDANLTSFFGNYMQLPPEDKRFTHNYNKYYWK